jgi:hypothetical protein
MRAEFWWVSHQVLAQLLSSSRFDFYGESILQMDSKEELAVLSSVQWMNKQLYQTLVVNGALEKRLHTEMLVRNFDTGGLSE